MKLSIQNMVVLCIFFLLTACVHDDEDNTIKVNGIGDTVVINETGKYNIDINGINNTVTVKTDNTIGKLTINGQNNMITLQENSTVDKIIISGSDNTIYVPTGTKYSLDDSGFGNDVIEQ